MRKPSRKLLGTLAQNIRSYRAERSVLGRRTKKLKTQFGAMQVKVLEDRGAERVVPEFEECRRVARKRNVPLREVYEAVLAAGHKK